MTENARKGVCGQLVFIPSDVLWRRFGAEPSHVALDEDLEDFTTDAAPALKRPPGAATCGHMRAKFHPGGSMISLGTDAWSSAPFGQGRQLTSHRRQSSAALCRMDQEDLLLPHPSVPD